VRVARFYANENFPRPAVDELRRLRHDVLTIQETGRGDRAATDAEVLSFAVAEHRIVLTMNRLHFIRLHRENPDHAGIVVCTQDVNFVALAGRGHAALAGRDLLTGQLVRVNRAACPS